MRFLGIINIMDITVMEYKILDHTADIGLEAYGRTAREAFINAAKGMFAILSPAEEIRAERSFTIEVEAETPEELLVGWLNQLIYLYDAEKVLLGHFDITRLEEKALAAKVSGETVDPRRHRIRTYIKAATHHLAKVELNEVCMVRVIFDV